MISICDTASVADEVNGIIDAANRFVMKVRKTTDFEGGSVIFGTMPNLKAMFVAMNGALVKNGGGRITVDDEFLGILRAAKKEIDEY